MARKALRWLACAAIVGACTGIAIFTGSFTGGPPGEVDLTIYAQRYYFEPPVVTVNRGDSVSINLITRDVTHGFYLEGYDIDAKVQPKHSPEDNALSLRHPSEGDSFQDVDRIVFVANKGGKFRFRCSQTCGYMHPFMQGVLIVKPNYTFWGGVGFCVGVAGAMLFALLSVVRKPVQAVPAAEQIATVNGPGATVIGATDEA